MSLRTGHTLVEVLVALTLVATASLGAAATVTRATAWRTQARRHLERLDDVRLTAAALRAAGCATDDPALPVVLHRVTIDRMRAGALAIVTIAAPGPPGNVVVTHTTFCP